MLPNDEITNLKKLLITPGTKVNLNDFDTKYTGSILNKKEAEKLLQKGREKLADIQDRLYAHHQYSVLIIFQAMDAAGKDGAVKHIMSGFNPLGVKAYSFKTPNTTELDHDYFWRHNLALPARGEIAIHNRSHYENVIATKVHPEWILKENMPNINNLKSIDKDFWQMRYDQINRFEHNLTQNGMVVLKFFLHLSKKEQKKRLLERIDDPTKNWKFSLSDLKERGHWDDYQKVYEEAISYTSQEKAPWHIIPADNKWYARLAIAAIIHQELESLNLHYPMVSNSQKEELQKAKQVLIDEVD